MTNPFVGPQPLSQGNPIFGRDREIAELRHLITAERFVLLHSPSGAGKSSLVNAGLIPELSSRFDVWDPTRVNSDPPPGFTGNRYVWSTLAGWGASSLDGTLAAYVTSRPRKRNILLIFDQFEEIIRTNPADTAGQTEFLHQLRDLLQTPGLWALFVIREDYLAPLFPLVTKLPTHLRSRYRIDLLRPLQAAEAIALTASSAGRDFQPAALQSLVQNLTANGHVEPMHLQVVCRRLWSALPPETTIITADAVAAFGDVDQALTGYYDATVSAIAAGDPLRLRAIRTWIQEELIANGVRSQVLLTPNESNGLDNLTIGQLLDAHLVRAEKHRGFTWFELAHDRLLAPVSTSNQAWFQNNLSALQRRSALWDRQKRLDGLLFSGDNLVAANQWAAANPALLTPVETDFLRLSNARDALLQREALQDRRLRRWRPVALLLLFLVPVFRFSNWLDSDTADGGIRIANNEYITVSRLEADYRALANTPLPPEANSLSDEVALASVAPLLTPGSPEFSISASLPVAISHNGRLVLTARPPSLIPLDGGPQVPLAIPPGRQIRSAVFSPVSPSLAIRYDDDSAQLWSLSGQPIGTPLLQGAPIQSLAFSPDGTRLLTASGDHSVRLWAAASAEPIGSPLLHPHPVLSAAFHSDGLRILTLTASREARVWAFDPPERPAFLDRLPLFRTEGIEARQFGPAFSVPPNSVSAHFSSTGAYLIVTFSDSTSALCSPKTGTILHGPFPAGASVSPGGRRFAAIDQGRAQQFNSITGLPIGLPRSPASSVLFSGDGRRILTYSSSTLKLWPVLPDTVPAQERP